MSKSRPRQRTSQSRNGGSIRCHPSAKLPRGGRMGIIVNTLQSGPTDTVMKPNAGPVSKIVSPGMAIGHYGNDDEVASVVVSANG